MARKVKEQLKIKIFKEILSIERDDPKRIRKDFYNLGTNNAGNFLFLMMIVKDKIQIKRTSFNRIYKDF